MSTQPNAEHPVKACPVCQSVRTYYLFSTGGHRVVRCEDCGLVFLNPQPSDEELARIYSANYFLGSESETGRQTASEIKQATAGFIFPKSAATMVLKADGCWKSDAAKVISLFWPKPTVGRSPASNFRPPPANGRSNA